MMPTRAQAEDLADEVSVELEELPAVVDAVAAMLPTARGCSMSGPTMPTSPPR